jgi:UDP-N-acetylmuramate--alanine ligase
VIFADGARVHVVGVGGAGMSALAVVLSGFGCEVSGCDAGSRAVLDQLRDLGIGVVEGHDAAHVADADVVLWSPAVSPDHVELLEARRRGARLLSRPEVLAELGRYRRVVGITGTHGKTTATSMLVHILRAAGRDDARLVGAPVRGVGFGGYGGAVDLIVEVDESYGAFTQLTPYALGLLNVEADHLDHYGSLAVLEGAFVDVLERTTGPAVVWRDDPGAARVAAALSREYVSVGTSASDEWRVVDAVLSRRGAHARLVGESDLDLDLGVTGHHNLANAAIASVVALNLGVGAAAVSAGLANFTGAPRRFERLGTWRGLDVVDDYAHLPGEISATVEAARASGYQRIAAVFQPHRVTRTINIGADFAPAFDAVDEVIVTNIYDAGEPNPDGLTGEVVVGYLRDRGITRATYAAGFGEVAATLERVATGADLLLILGAGDVTTVLDHLPDWRHDEPQPVVSSPNLDWGDDPRVSHGAPLGGRTTYRVGGSARALLTLSSLEDLDHFSARLSDLECPLWVVGNGSNLLVADGEHAVLALHLEGEFKDLEVREGSVGRVRVRAGAGLDLPVAARRLAGEGIVGFEWAVGVPGTFGGAVAMNAGGHGSDMSTSVRRVEVWSTGVRHWRDASDLSFAYRSSSLAEGDVVTRVELELTRGDSAVARDAISAIVRWRRENQPGGANAGSVFRNPAGDHAGRLVELAGAKGLRVGSAMVSEKHANFIIADTGGRAADVAALMREVRERVRDSTGVWLEFETRLWGFEETP